MSLTARVAQPRNLLGQALDAAVQALRAAVQALRAEWTKLRTVSGPAWLLAGLIVLTVAVSAAATAAV
jgi:hypothetical protein